MSISMKGNRFGAGAWPLAGLLAMVAALAGPALAQDGDEAAVVAAQEPQAAAETLPVSLAVKADHVEAKLTPLTKDELAGEAAAVLKRARSTVAELADARLEAEGAAGEQAKARRATIDGLVRERRDLFDRLGKVLAAWEAKGGKAEEIEEYRQYVQAVTAEGIKQTNLTTLANYAGRWVTSREGGIDWGLRLAGLAVAFLLLLFVARFVRSLVRRGIRRVPDLSTLLADFLVKAAYVATIVLGLLVVLTMMGVNMAPVFAVVGGASFIIAFAMQSTLSNFAAGLMIMIYKPFDVGHYVTLAGVSGTVKAVSLVSTTLATPDNQTIMIPNSNVWGSIITNVTVNDTRRVDLVFGIAYSDDEDKAQKILEEIVKAHPLVLADPEPVIRLHELADSSVNFICRPWTKTGDYWAVYWDLTQQVKARFDEEGISIPFPQREIHVYQHNPTA